MVVVIANDLPPAVRGRMKLWFIEPRANVFVSGIKDNIADGVINYLINSCPVTSGLLVFQKVNYPPYYKIWGIGDTKRKIASIDGLQLIFEKFQDI
ncbi:MULTISPECIES: type I-E CRISPR-associated endoribonuclease Cas2e [unclassified Oceanispirochaeta]|uniref:type I-E CRISPR-associated endoribonuclease Cas2e n=1 Tax=unclassified Oceanispirochaeta TaxID=2635722 RepID=UPI000E0988A5|nr:type I-E CRISPR-associated endoribonuclease Cas2e [Oceanispirochaeta sp. M1]MBF9014141.1 type I-E CRISPR-associated endoribonuclease Cas2 [Oceanispirochaeta sp. M2]NPD70631.1 type I-E CRISPR-associated endoribonuclease Cas2 [Oceanispirochaeta sp. M1]RDG34395.1 type I-E CRISPR-associated endoribonuclease Cas2 [Oceanispirochaeta sp. M1]